MSYGLSQSTSPNLELVKTALDALVDGVRLKPAAYGRADALNPLVFSQMTSDKAAEVTSVIGGGGYFGKRTGDFQANTDRAKSAATPKVTIIAEFFGDLPISRTFMADQQQSAVSKAVKQETMAYLASRDRNAMGAYALGFTTQLTIDAVALFSNTHVNQNGDTVDNLETGALADDTLNTTVVSLRGQLNQVGVKVGYEPEFLLVSSTGHKNAITVAKSVLRAGSGNNDLNYYSEFYPGMQVFFNQFLDDTSTTAYFIGTSGHSVNRYEREAFNTNLVDWKTTAAAGQPDEYKYLMRSREEVDTITYDGVVGSTGV